jgi:drug/metabolite transporter (DMT)-like permease
LVQAPPGLSQIVLAIIPIVALLLAVLHGAEAFRWRGLLGALLALAGVAVVFGERLGGAVPVVSLLAILVGAVAIAEGTVVVKLLPGGHPVAGSAVAMAVGTTLLLVVSLVIGERWSLPASAAAWWALLYLVIFGSVVVFVLFLLVVTRWTASATSYVWPLLPLVAVPVSAVVLRERVTVLLLLGGALVAAGVYMGAFASPRGRDTR